ncbi:MAG: TonB family protein [Acidobacteria bacterium]|nr:TonB family protein [Acidobacteriota bacterium]
MVKSSQTLIASAACALLAVLVSTGTVFAQGDAKPSDAGTGANQVSLDSKQREFDDGIARMKKGDAAVDIRKLRMLATELPNYAPYARGRNQKEMNEAANRGEAKEALRLANVDLEADYLDIDAHVVAMVSSQTLGDTRAFEHHRSVAFGIVDSIVDFGDGKSPETAFTVTTVREEYAVLGAFGLRRKSQSLDHIGGHSFDVLTVVDPDTNVEYKIYFNIDTIWKHQLKLFGGGKGSVPKEGAGAAVPGGEPRVVIRGVPGGVPVGVPIGEPGGSPPADIPKGELPPLPEAPPAPAPIEPPAPKVIRVSGSVLEGKAKRRVMPEYPKLARAAGIGGAVVVEVTVNEKGVVVSARAVSGHQLLHQAAIAAAREWIFEPTVIQGSLVKVVGTITFNFERG